MAKNVSMVGGPAATEDLRTGLDRQVTIDTSSYEIRVHDGATQGGHRIPNETGVQDMIDTATGGATGILHVLNDESELKALVPAAGIIAVVLAAGYEEVYVWRAGTGDQGTIASNHSGHWRRTDSETGLLVRLWRAGLIGLQVEGAEPGSSQATTAWVNNGATKLWNGSAYVDATPALFMEFLMKSGYGTPADGDMLQGAGGKLVMTPKASVVSGLGLGGALIGTNNLSDVDDAAASLGNLGGLAKAGGTMTGALGVIGGTVGAPGIFGTGDSDTGVYFPAANTIGLVTSGAEGLKVDPDGYVLTPKRPVFYAYSGDIASATSGTFQAGSNDGASPVEVIDVGNNYDIATGVFTAAVDGVHYFSAQLTSGSLSTSNLQLYLKKNGVKVTESVLSYNAAYQSAYVGAYLELAQGDTVEATILYANSVLSHVFASSFKGALVG